jgi:hypothetical protein
LSVLPPRRPAAQELAVAFSIHDQAREGGADCYSIKDLGSLNGLYIDDARIRHQDWTVLREGARLRFATKSVLARQYCNAFAAPGAARLPGLPLGADDVHTEYEFCSVPSAAALTRAAVGKDAPASEATRAARATEALEAQQARVRVAVARMEEKEAAQLAPPPIPAPAPRIVLNRKHKSEESVAAAGAAPPPLRNGSRVIQPTSKRMHYEAEESPSVAAAAAASTVAAPSSSSSAAAAGDVVPADTRMYESLVDVAPPPPAKHPPQLAKMIEELTCIICSELIYQAVVLDCSHSFCRACVNRWFVKNKKRNPCPVCREQHIGTPHAVRSQDNIIDLLLECCYSEAEKAEQVARCAKVDSTPVESRAAAASAVDLSRSSSSSDIHSSDEDEASEDPEDEEDAADDEGEDEDIAIEPLLPAFAPPAAAATAAHPPPALYHVDLVTRRDTACPSCCRIIEPGSLRLATTSDAGVRRNYHMLCFTLNPGQRHIRVDEIEASLVWLPVHFQRIARSLLRY